MEFNHKKPFTKQRSMEGVRYTQEGFLFNSGFKKIGKIRGWKPPKQTAVAKTTEDYAAANPTKRTGSAFVLQQLAKRQQAMSTPVSPIPTEISNARRENAAALAAEELAE